MENKEPTAQSSSTEPGNGHVFSLQLLREDGKLGFHVRWYQDQPTEQQKFEVAVTVDRIMRAESERYRDACAVLDEAARVGHKVGDYPLLGDLVANTIFIREQNDASELDERPQGS